VSLLSRISAPPATHSLAERVSALLSTLATPPTGLDTSGAGILSLGSTNDAAANQGLRAGLLPLGPTGLGTSAARIMPLTANTATAVANGSKVGFAPSGPTGFGTSAARVVTKRSVGGSAVPQLYCPPAVRDDPALGDEVNNRLVEWAGQVGIYAGQLDRVRAAGFGRLIMLAHPDTDDPDRLLAAAKCALAEWAVDDHYVDDEEAGANPQLLGERLAIANAVVDPVQLTPRYDPEFEEAVQGDPVLRGLRSSLDNLARYATWTQVTRLRRELAVMFVAYNQEAGWRASGRTPKVWEYLMHRHENSFLPCMVLIDAVGGYELPVFEFAEPHVRRVFTIAGSASVLVNDLYSMAKEDVTDTNLPRLIAAEEQCSLQEAIERSVEIHDELMHTFEAEAAAISLAGSPALRRFLAGLWAWLGGSREWHSGSARYSGAET
jgi:2-methylisoborneol synthase